MKRMVFIVIALFCWSCSDNSGFVGSGKAKSTQKPQTSVKQITVETSGQAETPVSITPESSGQAEAPASVTPPPVHLVSSSDIQVINAYAGESCDSKCAGIDSVCIADFLLDGNFEQRGGSALRGVQSCSTIGTDWNGGYYGSCICLKAGTANSNGKTVDLLSAKFKTVTGASAGATCDSVCAEASSTCLAGFPYDKSFASTGIDVLRNIMNCSEASGGNYPACMCLSGVAVDNANNAINQTLTPANFATTSASNNGATCDSTCTALKGTCMAAFFYDPSFANTGFGLLRSTAECSAATENKKIMHCVCFIN